MENCIYRTSFSDEVLRHSGEDTGRGVRINLNFCFTSFMGKSLSPFVKMSNNNTHGLIVMNIYASPQQAYKLLLFNHQNYQLLDNYLKILNALIYIKCILGADFDFIIFSNKIVTNAVLIWDTYWDKVIPGCNCLVRAINSDTQDGHRLEPHGLQNAKTQPII